MSTTNVPTAIAYPATTTNNNFDISKAVCCEENKFVSNCLPCDSSTKKFCCSSIYNKSDCVTCNYMSGSTGVANTAVAYPTPVSAVTGKGAGNSGNVAGVVSSAINTATTNGINAFTTNAINSILPNYTCCDSAKKIENCLSCDSNGKVDYNKCCSATKTTDCQKCPENLFNWQSAKACCYGTDTPAANNCIYCVLPTIDPAIPTYAPTAAGTASASDSNAPCCSQNITMSCIVCTGTTNAAVNVASAGVSNAVNAVNNAINNLPCCAVNFIAGSTCKKCENPILNNKGLSECTEQNKNLGPCIVKVISGAATQVKQNIITNASAPVLTSTGKAVFSLPQEMQIKLKELKEVLLKKATTVSEFKILYDKLNEDFTETSKYWPRGYLHSNVLDIIKPENASYDVKKEFNKGSNWSECKSGDYIFWCVSGKCDCKGTGCPKELPTPFNLKQTGNIAETNTNNNSNANLQTTTDNSIPVINKLDSLNNYFLSISCLDTRRVLFTEGSWNLKGDWFDFLDTTQNKNGDISSQFSAQQNVCNNIMASGTKDQKDQCRGQMNTQCSDTLDSTCNKTGLYQTLVSNPASSSAYPTECNDAKTDYSAEKCLAWINDKLLINTIGLNIKNLINLPYFIYNSQNASTTTKTTGSGLRYLQSSTTTSTSSTKVVSEDPVKKDSKALIQNAELTDSQITVDSATATTSASSSIYIQEVNQQVQLINSNGGYITFALGTIFLLYILILN